VMRRFRRGRHDCFPAASGNGRFTLRQSGACAGPLGGGIEGSAESNDVSGGIFTTSRPV